MEHPQPDETPRGGGDRADVTHVVVVVVRSGGIAGLHKKWRAEPPAEEAPRWVALIDDCPWDDVGADTRGADRYIWRISAERADRPALEVELPDSRLDGPWRTLVDEVRGAGSPRR